MQTLRKAHLSLAAPVPNAWHSAHALYRRHGPWQKGQVSQVGPAYGSSHLHTPHWHVPLPLHSRPLLVRHAAVSMEQAQSSSVQPSSHRHWPHMHCPRPPHTLLGEIFFIKLDLIKNHIDLCTPYLPFQYGQSKFAHSQYLPEYFSSGFSLWAHSQKPSTHLPLSLHTGSFGPGRHMSSFCDDESRLLWHRCPAYGSSHSHLPHTRAPWPLQSRLLSWRLFVHSHWPKETISFIFWSPIAKNILSFACLYCLHPWSEAVLTLQTYL